jgi:hypothetical protein
MIPHQLILETCLMHVLVATGHLVTLEVIKDGREVHVLVYPVCCIGVNQTTNSVIFLRCEVYFEILLGPITVVARYKTLNAFVR